MTIVNRRTFVASRGATDDVVNMLKQGTKQVPYRIYRIHYGQFDQIALEMEFDSIAHMEKSWEEWFASEEAQTFMANWIEITEPGGANEVWILEEQGG